MKELMKKVAALLVVWIISGSTAAFAERRADGEIIPLKIASSIYPGTSRTLSVWVPDAYDGVTPSCLIIRMDSMGKTPEAVSELMSEGAMPVTVAVNIDPGKIYKSGTDEVIRYNRSNEFDRTDGRFADFLEYEVIPALEGILTSDGRHLRISDSASDRALMGYSSGGIAAFNAVWERPGLFSRVYTGLGTFVPFRYGDQFPGIIRKTEPKPIRVFFQDNSSDTWNPLFGSWYEYNRLMVSAMEFAGYEMAFQWDEGGHDGTNAEKILKDVLRWLWAGWPEAPQKGVSANETLRQIVVPGEEWQIDPSADSRIFRVKKPLRAVYPGGTMVAEAHEGSCWIDNSIIEGGKKKWTQEYYCLHSPAYQILFDSQGYLYCATDKGIQICDHNGRVRLILSLPSGPVEAIALDGNRLYALSGGRIWVRTINRCGFKDPKLVPEPQREGQG